MGWSHPDITLEEMLKLVKGFVDILILASGYQSSGLPAIWDSHNIKQAFRWGLFFENVFRCLSSSDAYQEMVEELDAALSVMTADPIFPQGLAHLSSIVLTKARVFVLEHLMSGLPLRNEHLGAFCRAMVEMDLEELQGKQDDSLNLYLHKLTTLNTNIDKCSDDGFTKYFVQEILKKQSAVSCISSAEMSLGVLCKTIRDNDWTQTVRKLSKEPLKHFTAPIWNNWKSRNVSYFLDKRTVRLVSGAAMIFSAPKTKWMQVFERLNIAAEIGYDAFLETAELLLLGCVASRWDTVIKHFLSVSYECVSISKQYDEVRNLSLGIYQNLQFKEELKSSKEREILEYLAVFSGDQLHKLWQLPPSLLAVAIPSWSSLFNLYISELETQLKGISPTKICCNCAHEGKKHSDCELAERILCLYTYHVCRS